MKKDIKEQWVKALRSGEYKQGRHALKKEIDGEFFHCCLGVLCELATKAAVPVDAQRSEIDGIWTFNGRVGDLPEAVMEWSGMESSVGVLPDDLPFMNLAGRNDSGQSFTRIAEVIEEHF